MAATHYDANTKGAPTWTVKVVASGLLLRSGYFCGIAPTVERW
jgi:hypothetical protein